MEKNIKKAVLSNRIYMNRTPELHEELSRKLTYTLPPPLPGRPNIVECELSRINKDIITIPSGRQDLIPEDYEIVDKRVLKPASFPKFKFTLRESQQEVYDNFTDSCMLNANPSYGKTFTAIAMASKMKQKTLIIVHTKFLFDQWVDEINKTLGIKPGEIRGGKYEIGDVITIGMIQSLKKKITGLINTFGFITVDECLDYDVKLDTLEYGLQKIGKIVNNKLEVHVKSWNGTNFEYKKVLNYYKNKHTEEMIRFKLDNATSLICTFNHTLYTYRNNKIVKDTAENIDEREYLVCVPAHKTQNLLINNEDLLLGMIIGDGSLAKNNNQTNSIRIRVTNGQAQLNYLKYKKSILNSIVTSEIKEGISGYKKENKIYTFSTLSFVDINNWYRELYNEGSYKSGISLEMSKLLTKESWSIIYQDDGSYDKTKNTILFHCYMEYKGISTLIDSINCLFNIKAKSFSYIKNDNVLVGIRLNVADTKSFITQIEHLIHPDLEYKKGIYGTGKEFKPIKPIKGFESYTIAKIKEIDFKLPTYNNRYNIEVEDNHNYLANGKLVANCHHVPAPVFKEIVDKFKARYRLGLSATLWRKDGRHQMLPDYFGGKDAIFKPKDENKIKPKIIMLETDIKFNSNGLIPWPTRVSELYNNHEFVELVINVSEIYANNGYLVLTVSDRTEFLQTCADVLDNAKLIIGSTEDREIINSGCNPIFGSSKIFSEGVNIPPLSCLVLAMCINNRTLLEQLIGRISRIFYGKKDPIVIDFILKGRTGKNQAAQRINYYMEKGYKIEYITV